MSYTIKPWQDLTIQDDYMFKLVMRRKPICKRMLEKILHVSVMMLSCKKSIRKLKE